jgi:hypothetical protein
MPSRCSVRQTKDLDAMFPRPVARVKDLARCIDLGAKALGTIAGQCGLLEQHLAAGVRDVVFGHD